MSLRDLLSMLRRRWRFLVAGALMGACVAAVVTYSTAPTYQSASRLFISSAYNDSTDAVQGGRFATERVRSYATLVRGQTLSDRVTARVDGLDAQTLQQNVSALVVPDTVILEIRYDDGDPARSQQVSQAYAEELGGLVKELETPDGVSESPIQATIVDNASAPSSPVSPQPLRDIALGAGLGLIIGGVLAWGRDALDAGVKTDEDLQTATSAPMLGHIPYDASAAQRPLVTSLGPMHARAEAFRVLRTALQFLSVDSQLRSIVVTSSVPAEGKTSVAVNLGLTLARGGSSVVIVECDLRRPKAADYMEVDAVVGLTDVLAGQVDLADALSRREDLPATLLPSGSLPPNPAELLQSKAMQHVVDELEEQFDYVVIDAPPLLPVTDAAVLSAVADGVVLVVRHGRTTPDQVRHSIDRLEATGVQLAGLVLSMTPRSGRYGYGYGYGDDASGVPSRRRHTAPRGSRRSGRPSRSGPGAPAAGQGPST